MQCNAMQCNAMQCNAMQCNAMQCNAMQCSAMQCNAMHCIAMQCNAMLLCRVMLHNFAVDLHANMKMMYLCFFVLWYKTLHESLKTIIICKIQQLIDARVCGGFERHQEKHDGQSCDKTCHGHRDRRYTHREQTLVTVPLTPTTRCTRPWSHPRHRHRHRPKITRGAVLIPPRASKRHIHVASYPPPHPSVISQQARHIYPMFDHCCATVYDGGSTSVKHWVDVSCWLVSPPPPPPGFYPW